MDHQSNGEDKPKISRSKARHLRRKRLAAARRTDETSSFSTQSNTEQDSSLQEPHDILSKSKARRLRKKKAELIKGSGQTLKGEKRSPDSESQTELGIASQSPTNISEYERFDPNISKIQFESVEDSESDLLTSSSEIKALSSNPDGGFPATNRENDTLLTHEQNSSLYTASNNESLSRVQNESDSVSSDELHGYKAGFVTSLSERDYQIPKNSDCKLLAQGTSIDTSTRTELYQTSFESDVDSELFDSNNTSLSDLQLLLCEQNPDFKLIDSFRVPHFKSNQLSKNNEAVKEKDDIQSRRKKEDKNRLESTLHGLDIKSNNPTGGTTLCSLKTDTTSDDDLDSPGSNSSSNLIDQYEINTIQAHDSSAQITRTVLNTTELIENEKNLKISNSSANSHSVFQSNATVIDLTTYSGSDLIINTDEIIDFISDSSLDLVENNKLFYIDPPESSSTESQNRSQIHKKLITEKFSTPENQTSFDIIRDYSLPSTSVNDTVSPDLKNSKDSVGYNKNFRDLYEGKMISTEKTREQVKAEREAKKAAKALAKSKGKAPKSEAKIDAKSNNDAQTKAGSSEQVQKDMKQNVIVKKERAQKDMKENIVVKKGAVPAEEKIVKTETEIAPGGDNKENESRSEVDGKSKRESRAERRAKQEAQRAAKEKLAAEKNKPKSAVPPTLKSLPRDSDPVKTIRKTLVDNNLHEVKLFKHLYHERELSLVNFPTLNSHVHPAIVRLGVQYANKVIIGSNARCVALLAAVKHMIADFERPSQADFTRGLEASLQECAAYLQHCRPMAVSMQNALKHLKWQMTQLPSTVSDNDAKSKLGDAIDTYIREQILLAGKAISNTIQTKISNGDVILTYAFSSLIHNILIDAHIAGKQFRVIVVDGRPWLEGKEQLRRLAKHGIECSYILINALSFIMPEVTKVFLGAHAILANGAVMSRAGTAQVALMAKAFNVPVLVACETHKSCERVQTDSFVYNEIGDADELARDFSSNSKKSLLSNWKTKKSLDLLNITFDVTPADLVSAVVTELAILPCTSIPVILRIKPSEI